ncbi:Rieske (2Fe-2S) protein [Leekyejoonella antrihumi]|uniref:Cytochrome bc1 complex Rieske iron-sulfur subunit n=1 Tax=Leekyejoonella antrihumi TaxID=1660198 RepID=A0A563E417_9MICO|nr:Rieske (2Fe-2S) protein [Leekyejoonella antrihumi]TWP37155.1 Rieske (2Fe-2S) protein [Leekyejoonella antrihumi]
MAPLDPTGGHPGAEPHENRPERRTVLRGAGVIAGALAVGGAVTACGAGGAGAASGTPGAKGGDATVPASKVPEGGGYIDATAQVVATQPTSGQYAAFSAVCTHEGCILNEVLDRMILCPCHGSEFSITDGSVKQGPATEPLPRRKIAKVGSNLKIT